MPPDKRNLLRINHEINLENSMSLKFAINCVQSTTIGSLIIWLIMRSSHDSLPEISRCDTRSSSSSSSNSAVVLDRLSLSALQSIESIERKRQRQFAAEGERENGWKRMRIIPEKRASALFFLNNVYAWTRLGESGVKRDFRGNPVYFSKVSQASSISRPHKQGVYCVTRGCFIP